MAGENFVDLMKPVAVADLVDPDVWSAVREMVDICRSVCLECASDCASDGELAICLQRCLDCADLCTATSAVMTRQHVDASLIRSMLEVCSAFARA